MVRNARQSHQAQPVVTGRDSWLDPMHVRTSSMNIDDYEASSLMDRSVIEPEALAGGNRELLVICEAEQRDGVVAANRLRSCGAEASICLDIVWCNSVCPGDNTGSAPVVMGKDLQTPGDLIIYSLEDLKGCDFKRFRNKLSDFTYGDKSPIPRGRLEHADWITTKDILIDAYGEEGALDVTIKVFTLISLLGPANDLQEGRAQNAKLKKMTYDNRLSDLGKEYRGSVKEIFQRIPEYNSRMGEAVHLKKRFIDLLMRKGRQNKEEQEQEIRSSCISHLQTMEKRSPTTTQALFDPDEDSFIPKIVVLQGPAGIGKTMTSKKIMLDWASEDLYQDQFDFVFYLSCREINTIPGNISLVGLLSRTCRLSSGDLVSILEDPGSQRKLLIIVDGFDELRWTLEEESEGCPDISMETHKEIILQSLLRRQVLPETSLIITTRSLAIKKLNTFIDDSRNVEIQGFTRHNREEYVHKFFGNKEDADKVLGIIKDNDVLYTMCAVPIICWIVCTVMKQEIKKDLGLIRCDTMASIYLLYLEVLLTHHSKKQSVRRKQTCLKKLCALANQGVLNQQILFEKKDLERHGLSLDEVESVFLNENIFHWEVRTQTCYSFIHLSVQEFLAALYYGMDDGSGSMEGTFLPEICKGKSLSGFSTDYSHLFLAVQFLFGLLNENQMKTFSESTGINISFRARSAMKEWAMKDIDEAFCTHAIFCLYETQDEDFIRKVMSGCTSLTLYGSRTDHLWMDRNYLKQLSYCLKALKSESFKSLHFSSIIVGPKCQKKLFPLLHRCEDVRALTNAVQKLQEGYAQIDGHLQQPSGSPAPTAAAPAPTSGAASSQPASSPMLTEKEIHLPALAQELHIPLQIKDQSLQVYLADGSLPRSGLFTQQTRPILGTTDSGHQELLSFDIIFSPCFPSSWGSPGYRHMNLASIGTRRTSPYPLHTVPSIAFLQLSLWRKKMVP
ncbi:NACHT, LRR and PYD domains-containing protein 3-like [Rana temporaria]|uniref:NACHT, LRR and PYD domains-containing protein 3-like n=1 Tax=Rana temporaria TaxID=8407 RepID=UPI001AADC98D|nr:NACHT, LRR and PYD domains-containing protein 3-like [Rana temporaria]